MQLSAHGEQENRYRLLFEYLFNYEIYLMGSKYMKATYNLKVLMCWLFF